MDDQPVAAPDNTAVRTALWRALHVEIDSPHVFEDVIGLMLTLARDAGIKAVQHVSAAALAQRYFADRTDGLRPPDNSEELLVAST